MTNIVVIYVNSFPMYFFSFFAIVKNECKLAAILYTVVLNVLNEL